jgi:predicted glycosyl hydrolase (DUF1957 family)
MFAILLPVWWFEGNHIQAKATQITEAGPVQVTHCSGLLAAFRVVRHSALGV